MFVLVLDTGFQQLLAVWFCLFSGKQDVRLIQKRIRVIAVTKVRHEQSFWKNYLFYALILQCFGYILLVIAERYDKPRTQISKTQLWQAVHSLELRKLKKGEFDLAEETCVVCLETYKPRDVVRILTCRHIFHKRCIDRWLLKRRICPICIRPIIQNKKEGI
uniref:RING-type domain-containing protein n=1 Tax=Anolis carolinensis TaxID=28377 RepID=A0A803T2Y1_ANOCA